MKYINQCLIIIYVCNFISYVEIILLGKMGMYTGLIICSIKISSYYFGNILCKNYD